MRREFLSFPDKTSNGSGRKSRSSESGIDDIDTMAQILVHDLTTESGTEDIDDSAHNITYTETKLKESERRLTKFASESEKCFKNIMAELSNRHDKYLSRMSALHTNLQKDVKALANIKSDLSGFVCPSALSVVDSVIDARAEPKDNHMDDSIHGVKPRHTAPFSNTEDDNEKFNRPLATEPALKGDGLKQCHCDGLLTEQALKEHLFATFVPFANLKESVCEALLPIYEEVKQISAHTQDLHKHHDQKYSLAREVSDSGDARQPMPAQNTHEISLAASNLLLSFCNIPHESPSDCIFDSTGESSAVLPQNNSALRRGQSKLEFAADILGGRLTRTMDLLSVMHRYRMPGEDSCQAILPWFGNEPDRTSRLANALNSSFFEKLLAVIILANMVFITISADYAVNHPFDQSTRNIRIVEFSFQLFYCLELFFKLGVHRVYYFIAGDWHWNVLDALLVAASADDLAYGFSGQWDQRDRPQGNLGYLRVLRLARFLKVIRVFRVVRFVDQLHVLLRVVMSTLKPLFWCSVLLLVFFYIFAILFVNAAATYLANPATDSQHKDQVLQHWGSVSTAMITLYQSTTGGKDWADVSDILYDMGLVYYGFFLFFIAFIILALLNILTGIFVDSAMKVSAEDKDGEALQKLAQERATVMDLAKLHCVLSGKPVEDDGTITLEQFEVCMASPAMRARFSVMGLEIWDSKEFFHQLVALGSSEEVNLRTFVAGCMQMRGGAQRLGLQTLIGQVTHLTELVKKLSRDERKRSRKVSIGPARILSEC